MQIRPWRDVASETIHRLYDAEHAHWRRCYAWDTTRHWQEVEQARASWGLPGYVAFDENGGPLGWCFFVQQADSIQIGALVASTAHATTGLLDAVIETARATDCVSCFMPERAPGLHQALRTRGCLPESFAYLVSDLNIAPATQHRHDDGALDIQCWESGLFEHAVALLQQAYAGGGGLRFAPHDTCEEWQEYLASLVEQPGCGAFDPARSRIAWASGRVAGLVVTTRIDDRTAHVAQVAVHPAVRNRGVARRLMGDVMAAVTSAGCERVTLLCSSNNTQALDLYRTLGFEPRAAFVAASRPALAGRRAA